MKEKFGTEMTMEVAGEDGPYTCSVFVERVSTPMLSLSVVSVSEDGGVTSTFHLLKNNDKTPSTTLSADLSSELILESAYLAGLKVGKGKGRVGKAAAAVGKGAKSAASSRPLRPRAS